MFFYFFILPKLLKRYLTYHRETLVSAQLNQHLGKKLRLRRTSLGLTQTQVAKAINVTFQQIQKYEKGTNGVSSARLLQLANFLKVPIKYFFEDYQDFASNQEATTDNKNLNYSYLFKLFGDLEPQQKQKLLDVLSENSGNIRKVV